MGFSTLVLSYSMVLFEELSSSDLFMGVLPNRD
jgi:hypothetical protein